MYAVIDLETTGGDIKRNRIMEIAILVFDGEKVVDEFQTLVNPEVAVPDFITRITGINTEMVHDAPKFYEVAKKVVEMTEDCIFVAHNVRFDYSFIKNEFKSLGYNYQRKQLCTVRLARKVFPGLPSYSLGKLCKSLDIPLHDRHRAMGDARATTLLLKMLLENGSDQVGKQVKGIISKASRPPNLPEQTLQNLPNSTGVYYFHDENGNVIYVGKSVSIRDRVLSHFQNDLKQNRFFRMKERLHDITFEVTGSELIALLLESREIKRIQPEFNRAQRTVNYRYGVYRYEDQRGYHQLKVGRLSKQMVPVAVFATRGRAEGMIKAQVEAQGLCRKMVGIEKGKGPCFYYQIGRCAGACLGEESPEEYNERVRNALEGYQYSSQSFLILGAGRHESERSVVWVEAGAFQGYGYLDAELAWESPEALKEVVKPFPDHPEIHQLIRSWLRSGPEDELIPLQPQE